MQFSTCASPSSPPTVPKSGTKSDLGGSDGDEEKRYISNDKVLPCAVTGPRVSSLALTNYVQYGAVVLLRNSPTDCQLIKERL